MTDRASNSELTRRFEAMLAAGQDSPLLRMSLGQAYLAGGNPAVAVEHLDKALQMKPDYSAAWKFLGKAHEASHDLSAATSAYRQGLEVARSRGDEQLVREMGVFLRRLEKAQRDNRS